MNNLIKKSPIHGRGIFALQKIEKGDLIEECEVIVFSKEEIEFVNKTNIYNYYFEFEDGSGGVALGNGSLYNHSYNPNACYVKDSTLRKVIFTALETIMPGDEILVNYNCDPTSQEKVWFDK